MDGMDWISMGMGLLSGAQNGGDWSVPLQTFQGIQRENKEDKRYNDAQKRQAEQDAMQKELFGYQIGEAKDAAAERKFAAENRDRLTKVQGELAATIADPKMRQIVSAMSWENFGPFMGNAYLRELDAAAQAARDEAQRAFQHGEGVLDRKATLDAANLRLNGSLDASIAQAIAGAGVDDLKADAAPLKLAMQTSADISRMKEIVQELGKRAQMANPVDLDVRTMFERAKKMGVGTDTGALIDEFNNLQSNIVSQRAQQLKPVSNADFSYFQKVTPNANMSVEGAMNILNQLQEGINWDIDTNAFNTNWFKQYKGGPGTTNEKGQTREQARGVRPTYDPSKYGLKDIPPVTMPATVASGGSVDELPRTAAQMDAVGLKEGGTITDASTGQIWKRQGANLVPYGNASAQSGSVYRR